uniref:Uncharacterized protein n=1 Tax=Arundo donax TaxID=35708 RepID=A0A0A8ZAA6_ARUDO
MHNNLQCFRHDRIVNFGLTHES